MQELIKQIKEMGMDWFLATLEVWPDNTELENFDEVIEELTEILKEERSYAE